MNRLFLLTGSNLGDRNEHLNKALDFISRQLGKVISKSQIYRSESWGYKSTGIYYNQCIEVETFLGPHETLKIILKIEAEMGRQRAGEGYSDRDIDIDILFFHNLIIDDLQLTVPHPRFHLRRFALLPMNEIAGEFLHPILGKTISELLSECKDESIVSRV